MVRRVNANTVARVYGDEEIASAGLTIPHPGLREREFVVVPLLDLAPPVVSSMQSQPVSFQAPFCFL